MVCNKERTKERRAFTLAEVLITLLIIGVIASLTIPVITRKIQEADLKTAFKKSYSDIAQATDRIITNNGGSLKYLCSSQDHNCFANFYKQHMSVIKSCPSGTGELLGNCWHKDGTWHDLEGDIETGWDNGYAGLVLSNGTLLNFYHYSRACTEDYFATDTPPTFFICAAVTIDVNGFKSPNVVGKDIYQIYIQEDGLQPSGIAGAYRDLTTYPCNTTNSGWGCAAKVLQGN